MSAKSKALWRLIAKSLCLWCKSRNSGGQNLKKLKY